MRNKFLILPFLFIGIGFGGCNREHDDSNQVSGTIIGSYYNGFASVLIQVDNKFPIGNTIEYEEVKGNCLQLPNDATYQNLIQVQGFEHSIGDKILFSYRAYNPKNEEDSKLFNLAHGNTLCCIPNVPIYVIKNYTIIK